MSKKLFRQWLKNAAQSALAAETLEEGLEKAASEFAEIFPESKIWFAEKLGRRISYITGAGKESYRDALEITAANDYLVYLENIELSRAEKSALSSLMEIITYIKDDADESK